MLEHTKVVPRAGESVLGRPIVQYHAEQIHFCLTNWLRAGEAVCMGDYTGSDRLRL